ncbi:hypothetical protein DL770_008571 [Monosporascus sp. CRB-9-2]|nr:hypothetical protein DL770_008571 [Monosporascus sp. CRB-9-2]
MVGKTLLATTVLNALTGVSAFWRMQCKGRTGLARIDPIMDFGVVSTHVHALHGSSALTKDSTSEDLMNGNCTSCAVKQDMSAYWHPALYFQDDETGEFELVPQVGGMLAYYLLRNPEGDGKVKAFPKGFRMIAGSTDRRDYTVGDPNEPDPPTYNWASLGQTTQSDLEQRALGFNCLNYDKQAEGSMFRHYMPTKEYLDANCKDGLRLEIMFPSCWNGKDLDSEDHKSHMAYPDLVGDGQCPPGFPVRLVTLFFEVIWSTKSPLFEGRPGQFVVSNGDPTGFGYHADFMTGWDEDFLQEAVDRCTNPSGELFDCPVFMENGPLRTEAEQNQCTLEYPDPECDVDSTTSVVFKALPGNVDVNDTPGATTKSAGFFDHFTSAFGFGSDKETTTHTAPTLSYSPAPSSGVIGMPGGAFIETTASSASSTSASDFAAEAIPTPPPTTSAPPLPTVTSEPGVSYQVVSTETVTQGNQVEEIVWKEAVVYVTEDSVTTTVTPAAPLEKARRSHIARHQHHGRRV